MLKLIFTFILCIGISNTYAQSMYVTYKTIMVSDPLSEYTISATYPQVGFGSEALMGVRGIAGDINNSIDTTVKGIFADFEKEVSEMPSEAKHENKSTLEITGDGWVSNESILSTELTIFSNVSGMVHPLTTITAYNYTTDGMGPLSLSDLFKGDEYLYFISAISIKELMQHSAKEGYVNTDDMIQSGAAADTNNFNNWVIKNDSLKIIFKPYQVGPYVMGIQSVSIPLSDMTAMIDPKGPLSFMIR